MTKHYYTLKTEDVGRATLRAFGRVWHVADIMGRVFASDVGKRAYLNPSGTVQVENNEQRDQREATNARYFLTRDGERLKGPDGGPHATYNEALAVLHRTQGQSWDYAFTYGGYAIQRIDFALPDGNGKRKLTTKGN